jgi:predicted alpha/beta-fold hydrolase
MLQLILFLVMTFARTMKQLVLKNKFTLVGITLGAIAGYLYYFYVGCASGTCAITSSPINATIYGAVMGGLLVNIIKK